MSETWDKVKTYLFNFKLASSRLIHRIVLKICLTHKILGKIVPFLSILKTTEEISLITIF